MAQRVMTFSNGHGDYLFLDLLSKDVWLLYGEMKDGGQNIIKSGSNLEYGVSMALHTAKQTGFTLMPGIEVG